MSPGMTHTGGIDHIRLVGAPDEEIGNPKPTTRVPEAYEIELNEESRQELLRFAKEGKISAVLQGGKSGYLKIGNVAHPVDIAPATFRTELYKMDDAGGQDYQFEAVISHTVAMRKVKEVTAAANDQSLAVLQAKLADLRREKEENKTTFVNEVRDAKKLVGGRKAIANAFLKKPGSFQKSSRSPAISLASSPALIASTTSLPTSVSSQLLQPNKPSNTQPFRTALTYLLAIRPETEQSILCKTRIPKEDCLAQLQKIATLQIPGKEWKLSDRYYKDLQPWENHRLSPDDRQLAIDNAARAYDRLRITHSDDLWQSLLPVKERGKGTVLSKLNSLGVRNFAPLTPKLDASKGYASDAPSSTGNRLLEAGEPMARTRSTDGTASKKLPFGVAGRAKALSSSKLAKSTPTKTMTKKKDNKKEISGSKQRKVEGRFKSSELVSDPDNGKAEDDVSLQVASAEHLKSNAGVAKAPASSTPKVGPTMAPKPNNPGPTAKESSEVKSAQSGSSEQVRGLAIPKNKTVEGKIIVRPAAELRASDAKASLRGNDSSAGQPKPRPADVRKEGSADSEDAGNAKVGIKQSLPRGTLAKSLAITASPGGKVEKMMVPPKRQTQSIPSMIGLINERNEPQHHANGNNQVHKRTESTANSSSSGFSSVSGKSTPMHRQSSSQSSTTSIPASTMPPVLRKRPAAEVFSERSLPAAKKCNVATAPAKNIGRASASSSPLTNASDLGSVSSPSVELRSDHKSPGSQHMHQSAKAIDASQTRAKDKTALQRKLHSEPESQPVLKSISVRKPNDQATEHPTNPMSPKQIDVPNQDAQLESLLDQYHKAFATFFKLRIEADRSGNAMPDTKSRELWAASGRTEDLKYAIKNLTVAAGGYVYWSGIPNEFRLDAADETHLTKKLSSMREAYNKLWDGYSSKAEDMPKDNMDKIYELYTEMRDLKTILHMSVAEVSKDENIA